MESELRAFRNNYRTARSRLLSDIDGLTVEALDWQITPGLITIGTSLLHIIGFERMLIAAVEGCDVRLIIKQPEWLVFAPGFRRLLPTSHPTSFPLSFYVDLLTKQEQITWNFLGKMSDRIMSARSKFYADNKLFQDSGLEDRENRQLLSALLQHEQYHRGQITLLKYLFLRATEKSS